MTNQSTDIVVYQADEYEIAGIKGGNLFTPADFDLTVGMMYTACYRGYFCSYSFTNSTLFLTELSLRTLDGIYPPINGIEPQVHEILETGFYTGLQIPCAFTGSIILVRELIGWRGILPNPVDYDRVLELLLVDGKIQKEVNHSIKGRMRTLPPGYREQPPLNAG